MVSSNLGRHGQARFLLMIVFGMIGAVMSQINMPAVPDACTIDVRNSINWGAATSAYQVEGGWNQDGKTKSIWDTLAQTPGLIADNTTGDVAIDMYNRWREDIALMKQLGIKHYRFSIAWTRIVPQGIAGSPINMKGVDWYKNFILALKEAGIKPAVTMYHWDLPQVLQDKYAGFMSEQIQRDFLYYADALFEHLGPHVDQWMTFNEVISICELGYQLDVFAPQYNKGLAAKYTCGHNILLAHAKTIQLWRQKWQPKGQKARFSIALDGKWGYPRDPKNPADVQAAENFMVFQYAWMADPIYFGDYPKVMRETQGDALPKFTPEQSKLLKETTIGFFSVNFYCGYYVWAPAPGSPKELTYDNGANTGGQFTSPGIPTNAPWLFKTPDGLRLTLEWLAKRYNGPEFHITENGVSGPGEDVTPLPAVLNDEFRMDYYKTYIDNMCLAKTVGGVNVNTYYAWSLFDNFEWRDGFKKRFGIVYVDLNDDLKRYPKGTAQYLSNYFFNFGPSAAAASTSSAAAATASSTVSATAITKPAAVKVVSSQAAAGGKGFTLPLPVSIKKGGLGMSFKLGAK